MVVLGVIRRGGGSTLELFSCTAVKVSNAFTLVVRLKLVCAMLKMLFYGEMTGLNLERKLVKKFACMAPTITPKPKRTLPKLQHC